MGVFVYMPTRPTTTMVPLKYVNVDTTTTTTTLKPTTTTTTTLKPATTTTTTLKPATVPSVFNIKWGKSNKCLAVDAGKNANGTPITTWDCSTSDPNQKFKWYGSQIRWDNTDKCLDLWGGTAGNKIAIYTCDATVPNRQFELVNKSGIRKKGGNLAMTVSGGGLVNKTPIISSIYNKDDANQQFTFV